MNKLILVLIFSWLSVSSASAATIGIASAVEGDVQLLRGEQYYQVQEGVEFRDSDAVVTGEDSKLQIDMIDGSNLLVSSNTRIRLSEYTVDENNNVVSAAVDVISGWLRFAVAKLNENSTYSIDTPTMTIGIRGTEGVIEAGEDKSGLFLDEGQVDLYEVGGTGGAPAPLAITGGQYAERLRGNRLQRLVLRRERWKDRMPPRMQARLERRIHRLQRRSVKPRLIRAARRQELRRFLLENPEARREIRSALREKRMKRRELRRKRFQKMKQLRRQRMRHN